MIQIQTNETKKSSSCLNQTKTITHFTYKFI
jgi:hypothetical protein